MALSPSSTSYGVYPTYPPASLLKFDPFSNPAALSPPQADRTLARPFDIPPEIYANLLHVAWPITIASIYIVTVRYLNNINKDRQYKPWSITQTHAFYFFVLLHNISLTVFSGWVFSGMVNAIRHSWPGWNGEYGLAGATDALCKIHGPRGLGGAASYSLESGIWSFKNRALKLVGGEPDATDIGRIWNEGLGYYGFLFYLSKFYEVVDTAIILAKGKRSSELQTFHHAGAMLCMWAGIRYMSPPIWMFTFINSGLHTLLYLYYTLSALTIRVPKPLKQTLTSLQIIQIVFGGSYALLHLFIAYDVPVQTPYSFAKNLSTALPTVASTVSSAAYSLATGANIEAWLKKLALRAAGEEGLAENVRNYKGQTFGVDAVHAAQVEKAQEEVRYRTTTQRVNCLDTSGEAFAILLNITYLAPLAYLFVKFFVETYIIGKKSAPRKEITLRNANETAQEAVRVIEAKIKQAMQHKQGGTTEPPPELKAQLEDAKKRARQTAKDLEEFTKEKSIEAKDKVGRGYQDGKAKAEDLERTVREKWSSSKESTTETTTTTTATTTSSETKPNGSVKEEKEDSSTSVEASDAVKARGEAARKEAEKNAVEVAEDTNKDT